MAKLLKFVLAGLAALATSCAGPATVKEAGQEVSAFHDRFNEKNYEAVWNRSSGDLRHRTTEQDFANLLATIRGKMGKVVSAKQVGWKSSFENGDSFVTINMETTFERGSRREEFVYRKTNSRLDLAGYHITWDIAPTAGAATPAASQAASP